MSSSAEWQRLDAQLPSDHVARQLASALHHLDLAPLWNSYTVGGTDALRPDLMLTIVLVEMWSGRRRPAHKIVVSATDPAAAIGKDKEGVFRPLYDVQLLTDLDSPLYLAFCEAEHIDLYGPWQERDLGLDRETRQPARSLPKEAFAWEPDAQQYRCPEGHPLTHIGRETKRECDGEPHVVFRYRCAPAHCSTCTRQKECTTNPKRGRSIRRSEHQALIDRHCQRMKTPEAIAIYRLRRQTVELGYADLKHNREFRRFSGRGLKRARIEIGLVALAHNLHVIENALPSHTATQETREIPYVDTS